MVIPLPDQHMSAFHGHLLRTTRRLFASTPLCASIDPQPTRRPDRRSLRVDPRRERSSGSPPFHRHSLTAPRPVPADVRGPRPGRSEENSDASSNRTRSITGVWCRSSGAWFEVALGTWGRQIAGLIRRDPWGSPVVTVRFPEGSCHL